MVGKQKKQFYKWRWMIALEMTLLIAACSNEGSETNDVGGDVTEDVEIVEEAEAEETAESEAADEESAETEVVEEVEASNEIVLGEPIELGDYTMTIQGYELAKDFEGKDALIVTYDWVNNSEETTAPFMTFMLKGFQNGVETGDVFMVDGVDLGRGQSEVRPDGVIEGAQAIVAIDDLDALLELELDELFSFEDNAFITELDLSAIN